MTTVLKGSSPGTGCLAPKTGALMSVIISGLVKRITASLTLTLDLHPRQTHTLTLNRHPHPHPRPDSDPGPDPDH